MSLKKTINHPAVDALKCALTDAEEVAIFSHIHADGDTLGAQLGLAGVLRTLGKKVSCYNMGVLPGDFAYLEGFDQIQVYDPSKHKLPNPTICVDCGSLARTGADEWLKAVRLISIDHHAGNDLFAEVNFVNPDSPATCEMLAALLRLWEMPVSPDVATALYSGISTDTGSFKYEQTSADTLDLAAWLLRLGADYNRLRLEVYESTSKEKFGLLKHLYSHASFHADGLVAIARISQNDIRLLQVNEEELHGLVGLLKEVEGVEVSALFRELPSGHIKVSLRSKACVDLNRFAAQFGGGGHARAAGATLALSMNEAEALILPALCDVSKEACL